MDYLLSFPAQLSQHLRSLRKALGLSQVQLAQRIGVTQSRIADLEKNASSISLDHLHKVLAALGVELVLRETGVGEIGMTPLDYASQSPQHDDLPKGEW
jgi:HTH-type transcriptional regulator/antitoxin HipB